MVREAFANLPPFSNIYVTTIIKTNISHYCLSLWRYICYLHVLLVLAQHIYLRTPFNNRLGYTI